MTELWRYVLFSVSVRASEVKCRPCSSLQRPYLKTFLRYVMHPKSPYSLAIWTFSGRMYGIAHLRQVGMGSVCSFPALVTRPAQDEKALIKARPS